MAPAHVLMVAAENDSLAGGKVGGVGDVLRDIPTAIVQHPDSSSAVSVVVPSYGFLHRDATASRGTVTFQFGGTEHEAELFVVPGRRPHDRIRQLVMHHPALSAMDSSGRHRIYVDDGSDRPFASDATRFALFCAATAEALLQGLFDDEQFGTVDQLHLHDWHASFLHVLRHFDTRYASLNRLPVAFTIHNLGLQGIRPLCGDVSSLTSWYPHLFHETGDTADRSDNDNGQKRAESPSVEVVGQMVEESRTDPVVSRDVHVLIDPDYRNCINPMAVSIRLSDRVHAVSPSYADEVCQASRPGRNDSACVFFGGEGLEGDLQQARDQGRLCGILNGCEYDAAPAVLPVTDLGGWMRLLDVLIADVQRWYARTQIFRHWLALQRLQALRSSAAVDNHRPIAVFTSVTRVVDQKVRLLRGSVPGPSGRFENSPLDQILSDRRCVYLLLGTGDAGYESFLDYATRRNPNLVFLNGFSLNAADALYEQGDLFLMPSAFEPCGISQMLAMRAGQPCVVHAIGGLKDTVQSDTGFSFSGDTPEALDRELVECVRQAVEMKASRADEFQTLRSSAITKRFLWSDSVRDYFDRLYAK